MKLRTAPISDTPRSWAIIDSEGRDGDEILACGMTEADAATCMVALFMARRPSAAEGRRA